MKLHDYQLKARDWILEKEKCGLFLDMGLGKTVSALTAVKILLYEELEISKVLVIAPKRVAENVWTDEIEKWKHLNQLKTSLIIGTPKQRLNALEKDADIYIIGRDNVVWLYNQRGLPVFDMLIIDESSSFKSPKAKRFKALRKQFFKRVVLLTGTPAANGLMDLWSQLYLLDKGKRLGKFITHYRNAYFNPGARNGAIIYNYILKKGSEQKIHNQIKDVCMSMKAKDYLQLPERINNYIDIKFDKKTQAAYDEFEKEQVLAIFKNKPSTDILALNAATLSNKLLQFANGAVYDEDKNWHEVHNLKLLEAKELIENANGKPVLIAWTYRHDMYRLMEFLKQYKPRELKTSQDIKDWNAGKIQVLLMHPASGGHGLNLQFGGNIIIWFGQTWSLELYSQLNARLDRQGQDKPVIIHHLIAQKTIDQKVVNAIKAKDNKQENLMRAIKLTIEKYFKNN